MHETDQPTGDLSTPAPKQATVRPCVVISQPMYFPWTGLLEQIHLCDVFVDYNDVQFSKGGFLNRVQIKTPQGIRWLTVPLQDLQLGQLIRDVKLDNRKSWQRSQLDQLRNAYSAAPHLREALDLMTHVFDTAPKHLGELARASMQALLDFFPDLSRGKLLVDSWELGIGGTSTDRVVDICLAMGAKTYLTGHGAKHYLDHNRFETRGMTVEYIDYGLHEYPQLHGQFTPFVSTLDLVANCGVAGIQYIGGKAIPWRDFLASLHRDTKDIS